MTKSFFKKLLLTALFTSHITPSVHAQQWNLHYSYVGKTLVETQKRVTTNTHVSVEDKYALGIIAAIGGIIAGYTLYSWADNWYQSYKENKIPLSTCLQEAYDILNSPVVQLAQNINWNTETVIRFNQIEQLGLTRLNGYQNSYEYKAAPTIELIKKKIKTLNRRKENVIELVSVRKELQSALSLIEKLSELIRYHRRVQHVESQVATILSSNEMRTEAYLILKSAPYEKITRITDIIIDSRLTHAAKAARNHSSPVYPFINYRQELLNLSSKIKNAITILENSDLSIQRAYKLHEFKLEIQALQKVAVLVELHPTYIVELNLKQQEDARRREEEHRQEMARVARRQMEQAEKHQREMERLAHQQARATENLAEAQKMQAAAQLAAALNPQPQHITIEIHNDN